MKSTALAAGAAGTAMSAVASTGWGLVAVAGMVFVVVLLALLSDSANRRFCRLIAVFRGSDSEPFREPSPAHTQPSSEAKDALRRTGRAA